MERKFEANNKRQSSYISSFVKNRQDLNSDKLSNSENSAQFDSFDDRSERQKLSGKQTELATQQQLKQKKHHALKNLNSQERKVIKKIERKIGRPLSDLEEIDIVEHIIYEPERILSWLEEENEEYLEKSIKTADEVIPENTTQSKFKSKKTAEKTADLNLLKKVIKAIKQAILYLPARQENKFKALLTSKKLIIIISLLGIWRIASKLLAIDQLLNICFILLIGALFGWKIITLSKDLIGFINVVNATTEKDINISGKHLAKIISALGIDLMLFLLVGDKIRRLQNSYGVAESRHNF